MRIIFGILVAYFIVATSAQAAAGCYGNDSTAGVAYCAASIFEVDATKLNRAWEALAKENAGDADKSTAIKASRAAWSKYRDAYCAMVTTTEDDDRFDMVSSDCAADLTKQMFRNLYKQLHCGSGYGIISGDTLDCIKSAPEKASEELKKVEEGLKPGIGTGDDLKAREAYLKTIR